MAPNKAPKIAPMPFAASETGVQVAEENGGCDDDTAADDHGDGAGELTATALHTVFDCHTEIDETENDEDAAEKGDASGNLSHDLREHTLNSFL